MYIFLFRIFGEVHLCSKEVEVFQGNYLNINFSSRNLQGGRGHWIVNYSSTQIVKNASNNHFIKLTSKPKLSKIVNMLICFYVINTLFHLLALKNLGTWLVNSWLVITN